MKVGQTALTVSACSLLAATVVAVAAGAPSASKQRIAIDGKFNIQTGKSTWKLIPLSKGELTSDAGRGAGTGSAGAAVGQNGQSITPNVGGDTPYSQRGVTQRKESRGEFSRRALGLVKSFRARGAGSGAKSSESHNECYVNQHRPRTTFGCLGAYAVQ